jgi:hypothetical protein
MFTDVSKVFPVFIFKIYVCKSILIENEYGCGRGRTGLRALSISIRVKRTVNKLGPSLGTMKMEIEVFSETLMNICKVI